MKYYYVMWRIPEAKRREGAKPQPERRLQARDSRDEAERGVFPSIKKNRNNVKHCVLCNILNP
jgi:hypothetical protein